MSHVLWERSHFAAYPALSQFAGDSDKILVACYEYHYIRTCLDGKRNDIYRHVDTGIAFKAAGRSRNAPFALHEPPVILKASDIPVLRVLLARIDGDIAEKFLRHAPFTLVGEIILEVIIIDVDAFAANANIQVFVIQKNAAFLPLPLHPHTENILRTVILAWVYILAHFPSALNAHEIARNRPKEIPVIVVAPGDKFAIVETCHFGLLLLFLVRLRQ